MSARLPCSPAPGPLESFAVQFDPLFQTLAQRQGFRTYSGGLLMRHPDKIAPPSARRKKNWHRESDALLDLIATRGTGLSGPGALAGALLGRVLQRAPAP